MTKCTISSACWVIKELIYTLYTSKLLSTKNTNCKLTALSLFLDNLHFKSAFNYIYIENPIKSYFKSMMEMFSHGLDTITFNNPLQFVIRNIRKIKEKKRHLTSFFLIDQNQ